MPRPLSRAALALALMIALASCKSVADRAAERVEAGRTAETAEAALIEYQAALSLDPDLVPAYLEIARLHDAAGALEPSIRAYLEVLVRAPGQVEAELATGRFFLLTGDLEAAAGAVARVAEAEPDNPEGLALAAAVALNRGEAADDLIAAAEDLAPENRQVMTVAIQALFAKGEMGAALAETDRALALFPGDRTLNDIRLGLLAAAEEAAAVQAQLQTMIALFPDDLALRERLVGQAVAAGDAPVAEAALRGLAEAEPDRPIRVADLATFLLARQGVAAARAELEARAVGRPGLGLLLADFELEMGATDRAEMVLEEIAETGGQTALEARVQLARLYLAEGEVSPAEAQIDAVLSEDPGHVGALRLRVARLLRLDETESAVRLVRAALEEAPEDPGLLELDARTQELAGNIDLANDRFARAVRMAAYAPATVARYADFLDRTNRVSGAEIVLAEAVRRHPGEAGLVAELVESRIALNDWTGAETALAHLTRLDPLRARELRAATLLRQGEADAGRAALADVGTPDAAVRAHLAAGEIREAAVFLDARLAETPADPELLGLRGAVHAAAGELAEAGARYQAVLAADPGHVRAHLALASLAAAAGDAAAVETWLRAGLEAAPGEPELSLRLAVLRQRAGDIDEAIALYEAAYSAAPDALIIANNLASLLADHRGDDPQALERAYTIAGRLATAERPSFRDTYAWTRHLRGEHEAAREVMARVVEEMPDNPWAHFHAGMIHLALDDAARARDHLEAALEAAGEGRFAPRADIVAQLAALGPVE